MTRRNTIVNTTKKIGIKSERKEKKRSSKMMRDANNTGKISKGFERFESKPSQNNHPTVKPVKLLRYLCKLITPDDGTVLDPFMGSGSTGIAALKERFNFIGIEKKKDYFEIAAARIKHAKRKLKPKLTDYK